MAKKTLAEALELKSWNDKSTPQNIKDYYNTNLKGKKTLNFTEYQKHLKNINSLKGKGSTYNTYASILSQTPIYESAKPEEQTSMMDSLKTYLINKKDFKTFKPKALDQYSGGGTEKEKNLTKTEISKLNNALGNFTSTLELNDPEGLKEYAKEIISIKPELADSLNSVISLSIKEPDKAKKEWFSGKWFSKIKNAWNENVENTNKMVKSPPPNLQKD
tara:strand:+ start:5384 stop:6037 length:654 start_codon:yes stop_codon:yes gene_type:complete